MKIADVRWRRIRMDDEGFVHVSNRPGLGRDINWDYVRENTLAQG